LKKYYKLTELDKAFGISVDDAHYLNSETDVSFCVFCSTSDVILGGYRKGKFVGLGCASYSGLVSLEKAQQTKLFENKEVSLKGSVILQKDKVSGYTPAYPFTVKVPNPIITEWLSAPFAEIPFLQLPYIFKPEQRENMLKQAIKIFNGLGGENIDSLSKLPEKLDPRKPVVDELFSSSKIFKFDDLCITSNELEKAKSYLFKTPEQDTTSKLRPIDILLTNMIAQFPVLKPSQIWEKLKSDLANDPRAFDTDEIIDELGDDALYWFDHNAEIQQMKKKSFYNLVSRLKK
jgi:hypothetical protein